MNLVMRIGGAAVGIAFLLGLAYYQGGNDSTLGEDDKMLGTAVATEAPVDSAAGNTPEPELLQPDTDLAEAEKLASEETPEEQSVESEGDDSGGP